MPRLPDKDIIEIFKLFELELNTARNLSKVDKMRLRKSINYVLQAELQNRKLNPNSFIIVVEKKLYQFLSVVNNKDEFLQKLEEKLTSILKELEFL